MGAAMAPSYANTYMTYLEERFVLQNPRWKNKLKCLVRFIDDLFGIWNGSVDELNEFFTYMNTITPRIKFTHKFSQTSIEFLDVKVYLKDNKLETTIFTKTTDRNSLLLASSFHPKKTIESIPLSQFLRYRRIISNEEEHEIKARDLTKNFLKRRYSADTISRHAAKVKGTSRTEAMLPRIKNTATKLVYVTTYSHQSNSIKRIITKNWKLLELDPKLAELFPKPPLFAYAKSPSIRDHLMKSDIGHKKKTETIYKGTISCNNCNCCNNLIKGNEISPPHNGKRIQLHHTSTCDTSNVIYGIKCPCGLYYVGLTGHKAKT
ncbi:uncharacterized protein [Ambystoma mexicanum]|uniref:uncharacterized protein n=1 Tax=Ambystoma mexicanum TaxID=8296 RepID=UPI0037E93D9D